MLSCTKAEPGFSKSEDGESEDKSKPRVEFVYSFVAALDKDRTEQPITQNYGSMWDYMSFSDTSGWKRAEVMKAFGVIPQDYEGDLDVEFDTDECINQRVIARIKHETRGQGKNAVKRGKISKLYKYGSLPDAVETADVSYGEAELPGDTDAGDVPDSDSPFGADEDEGPQYTA